MENEKAKEKALSVQIGQRIRSERIKFNLTQEKLSELIDVTPNFLGEVERGTKQMSLKSLLKICETLHTSLDYLVTGETSSFTALRESNEYGKSTYHELVEMLKRCSPEEHKIFLDLIKTLLPHLKK